MKMLIAMLAMSAAVAGAQTNSVTTNAPAAKPRPVAAKIPATAPVPVTPQRVQITAVLANYGFIRCNTDHGEMMISGLPPTIATSLTSMKQLDTQIENLRTQIMLDTKRAREADAVAPKSAYGDVYYVEAQMAKRQQANLMMAAVENKKDDLAALEKKRADVYEKMILATTVMAYQTPQRYANLNVWRYIGPAPKEEKPATAEVTSNQ